jgi:hypothetical protein
MSNGHERIREAVTELFLRTGSASSAADQAAYLGCSESTVRKAHRDSFGSVDGTTVERTFARRKAHWLPDRDHLRKLIISLRELSGSSV